MVIPKIAARKLISRPYQIVKGYILDSWSDLDEAAIFLARISKDYLPQIAEKGPLSIGFTFNYGEPTLDVFVLKTPDDLLDGIAWSEVTPFRIRKEGGLLDKFEDFCDTELQILEAERAYRELCLKTPRQGIETYTHTYPSLRAEIIDPRCQCVKDGPYKPFNL